MRIGFGLEQTRQNRCHLVGTDSGLIAAGRVQCVSEGCQIVRVTRSCVKYDGLVIKALDLEASQCRSALQTLQISHNLGRAPTDTSLRCERSVSHPVHPHVNQLGFVHDACGYKATPYVE